MAHSTGNSIKSVTHKRGHLNVWLAFVQFVAESGENFDSLIEREVTDSNPPYIGAWAHVLADSIHLTDVSNLIELGLRELKFKLVLIEEVENTAMLVDEGALKDSVVSEIAYMLQHGYKFMISDKIFPYAEGEE